MIELSLIKYFVFVFNKVKKFLTDIGFRHVWNNQGTLSRVTLLKSMQNKLEERYENFWNNLLSQNFKIMIIFGGEIS
jgi:hypothetical protein